MSLRYTTVLFDLDGTLTRSEIGITRSALSAAERLGYTGHTEEELKVFIGPPLFVSFRDYLGMDDATAEQATVLYRERYSTIGWAENEVYAGIAPMMRSLRKNGAKLAIVTGKPQNFAERIARRFGLMPYLEFVIGPGFDSKHSEKADMVAEAIRRLGGNAVMVGDRMFDVEGGKACSIDTIGVTYGYGAEQELVDAGATHIAHSVAELDEILLGDAERARGIFLTMEGVDGCGKTTQRNALEQHMKELGWEIRLTREPGGDAIAEKIRELLLDPENTAMCDETEAYLYAASRAQNVRAMIRPAMAAGKAVICDRFVDSSVAYQGGGRRLGPESIMRLNDLAVDGLRPDVTVYLSMSPQEALRRRMNASEPDRLEREKQSFFERTYEAYEAYYAKAGDGHVIRVDASQTIEEVTKQMLSQLDERLEKIPY